MKNKWLSNTYLGISIKSFSNKIVKLIHLEIFVDNLSKEFKFGKLNIFLINMKKIMTNLKNRLKMHKTIQYRITLDKKKKN